VPGAEKYDEATAEQAGAPGSGCSMRRAGSATVAVATTQAPAVTVLLAPAAPTSAAAASADTLPVLPSAAAQDMPGKLTHAVTCVAERGGECARVVEWRVVKRAKCARVGSGAWPARRSDHAARANRPHRGRVRHRRRRRLEPDAEPDGNGDDEGENNGDGGAAFAARRAGRAAALLAFLLVILARVYREDDVTRAPASHRRLRSH
jgi:hypothetical protein